MWARMQALSIGVRTGRARIIVICVLIGPCPLTLKFRPEYAG